MRRLAALTVVMLASCRHGAPSLDAEYQEARSLLSSERYDAALPKADEGLRRAERSGTEAERWRFRLLKGDILIGQRSSAKALAHINQYAAPPAGTEWVETRARVLLLRGRA